MHDAFRAALEQWPRDRFELFLLTQRRTDDAVTARLQARADHYLYLPETLAQCRDQIAALGLDRHLRRAVLAKRRPTAQPGATMKRVMALFVGLMLAGSLNPISVAFAVLFVGLGVDFGIQFSVRYRTERHEQASDDRRDRQADVHGGRVPRERR